MLRLGKTFDAQTNAYPGIQTRQRREADDDTYKTYNIKAIIVEYYSQQVLKLRLSKTYLGI